MSDGKTKIRLPIWAKLVLFVFFVCMALSVSGLVMGAAWVADMESLAHDKNFKVSVLKRMAQIDVLPAGFDYDSAGTLPLPILNFDIIYITHTPGDSRFWMLRVPNPVKKKPLEIAQEYTTRNPVTSAAMEVKSHGELTVGGQKMEYLLGVTDSTVEKPQQEFIGAVCAPGRKDAFILVGMNGGNEYNMETTKELTDAIKGF